MNPRYSSEKNVRWFRTDLTFLFRHGNHLLNIDMEEQNSREKQLLLGMRESRLKNDELVERFYERVIEALDMADHYMILLFHDVYDVPVKTKDNQSLDDSQETYEYLLCAVCPVVLSKPGLAYHADSNEITLRERDWVVGAPQAGFLFPAFTERSTDINAALYYTKNAKAPHMEFAKAVLGCDAVMTAEEQREIFQDAVRQAFGDACSYEAACSLNERLHEFVTGQEDAGAPIGSEEIGELLAECGADDDALKQALAEIGERTFYPENLVDTKKLAVRTCDVLLQTKPEKASQIRSDCVNGRKCLVIPVESGENVTVNGMDATV